MCGTHVSEAAGPDRASGAGCGQGPSDARALRWTQEHVRRVVGVRRAAQQPQARRTASVLCSCSWTGSEPSAPLSPLCICSLCSAAASRFCEVASSACWLLKLTISAPYFFCSSLSCALACASESCSMLLITKVGSATLRGFTAPPAPGACGGAFALGFLAFGFLAGVALLELAGLATGAESGRIGRGEDGRAIGLARGFSIVTRPQRTSSPRVREERRAHSRAVGCAGAPGVAGDESDGTHPVLNLASREGVSK